MTTATTVEAVQQTLAEYEAAAIATGEWNGTDAPEFSNDGIEWTTAWLPSEGHDHPALARATVYRKGVERPVVVIVRWDEAVPVDADWEQLWRRKPIALFGAFTIRAALRRAFRDVIGERREPDEQDGLTPPPVADRDWLADLAAAETEDSVKAIHAEAKAARVVTVELEREIRKRLATVKGLGIGALLAQPAQPTPKTDPALIVVSTTAGSVQPRPVAVTPADIAKALQHLPKPTAPARPKSGRRPQKPKPRGNRD